METTLSSIVKTADRESEKHIPIVAASASAKADESFGVEIDGGKEVPRPNTAQHYSVWIAQHFVPDGSHALIELGCADFSACGASMTDVPGPAATDPAALRRMGEAARAAFEASDCRPDRNLARLLDIYESVRR